MLSLWNEKCGSFFFNGSSSKLRVEHKNNMSIMLSLRLCYLRKGSLPALDIWDVLTLACGCPCPNCILFVSWYSSTTCIIICLLSYFQIFFVVFWKPLWKPISWPDYFSCFVIIFLILSLFNFSSYFFSQVSHFCCMFFFKCSSVSVLCLITDILLCFFLNTNFLFKQVN